MIGALPIVKPGGTIIIAQENAEGIGGPEFTELITRAGQPRGLHGARLRGHAVQHRPVAATGDAQGLPPRDRDATYSTAFRAEVQRQLFVEPVASVEAAVAEALRRHGPEATIAVIPEGPYVLACLRGDLVGRRTVREMIAASSLQRCAASTKGAASASGWQLAVAGRPP